MKNGVGGQWWAAAKTNGQLHVGWRLIPRSLLETADLPALEALIRAEYGIKRGATQDFNALSAFLDHPGQHIWITFQDGCMWWCTVHDGVELNPDGESNERGNFWLRCARPWSNHSIGGRHLAMANLPGIVTTTAGYQATVCEPKGWNEVLRIIHDEEDADAAVATEARRAYQNAVAKLVGRLREKDFEVLVDLILSRTGWARVAKLGGVTEGIDVEVENPSTDEIAFVQVKSTAGQSTLDDYVAKFSSRRERYNRMIFAVHTPSGKLAPPDGQPVQVWDRGRIAELVVNLGLGGWVARRL
jgi:hypothetical protein